MPTASKPRFSFAVVLVIVADGAPRRPGEDLHLAGLGLAPSLRRVGAGDDVGLAVAVHVARLAPRAEALAVRAAPGVEAVPSAARIDGGEPARPAPLLESL